MVVRDSFVRQSTVSARARLLWPRWQYHCLSADAPFLGEGRDAEPETRMKRGLLMRFKSRAVRAVLSNRGAGECRPSAGLR